MLARSIVFVILVGTLTPTQSAWSGVPASEAPSPSPTVYQSFVPGPQPSRSARPPTGFDVSRIGHRQVDRGMNFYSPKDEQLLGNKLAALVDHSSNLITDPLVTEYIDRIEQMVSNNSDTHFPIKVKIVKDVEANAYSLPGFIYLPGGLILMMENEAQLVAVLSHETAHVAARHMTRILTQQKIWKWSPVFAGGPVGYLLGRKVSPFFLMRTVRRVESDADLLGLQYDYASGYDPTEFVSLIKNLSSNEEKPSFVERFSDSHPPAEVRIARAQQYIRNNFPVRDKEVVDTGEFQEVKARVNMLMAVSD
jgi:predicted Zn-dependent protease